MLIRIIMFPIDFIFLGLDIYRSNKEHNSRVSKTWKAHNLPKFRDLCHIAWWRGAIVVCRKIDHGEDVEYHTDIDGVDPYYLVVSMGTKKYPLPWFKPLYLWALKRYEPMTVIDPDPKRDWESSKEVDFEY